MAGTALHRLRATVKPLVPRRFHSLATRLSGRAVALALTGNAVVCPCCDARLRRFVIYPSLYCPRCGSYERHRLLALHLNAHPELLAPPLRVLQVSPDRPLERMLRREGLSVVSIDLDNPTVDFQMDVQDLSFEGESFDAVLCLDVLDSVPDQPRALRELHRVLRPAGLAIFQVPIDHQARLAGNLEAGFATEIARAAALGPELIARNGLSAEEEIFVARRL